MNARVFGRMILRHWILAVTTFCAVLLLSLGITLAQPPQYESTSRVYVAATSGTSITDLSQSNQFSQAIVASLARVVTTDIVTSRVADSIGGLSASDVANSLSASAEPDTVIIDITAVDRSPARAADIANRAAEALGTVAGAVNADATGAAPISVTVLQRASPSTAPVSPNFLLNLVIGILGGLGVAIAASTAIDALRVRIADLSEFEAVSQVAVLGATTFQKTEQGLVGYDIRNNRSGAAEEYRSIRAKLRFITSNEPGRVLIVTSAVAAEGKSTLCVNLARALAAAGQRVLLVDGDLRRPSIADKFGVDGAIGLTDLLVGTTDQRTATQTGNVDNLDVLPSGELPPNPSELLASTPMAALISTVRTQYDTVLVDAPPVLAVADALVLGALGDGVLIVHSPRRARRAELASAMHSLRTSGVSIRGAILTMLRSSQLRPSAYDYYAAPNEELRGRFY